MRCICHLAYKRPRKDSPRWQRDRHAKGVEKQRDVIGIRLASPLFASSEAGVEREACGCRDKGTNGCCAEMCIARSGNHPLCHLSTSAQVKLCVNECQDWIRSTVLHKFRQPKARP